MKLVLRFRFRRVTASTRPQYPLEGRSPPVAIIAPRPALPTFGLHKAIFDLMPHGIYRVALSIALTNGRRLKISKKLAARPSAARYNKKGRRRSSSV